MPHECGFDAVCDFSHALTAASALISFDGCLGVGVSAPCHRVFEACAGGDGGGDGRGSQGVEVQIRSSGVDFGLVEVVAQAIGGDVRSVGAGDNKIGWPLILACLVYELSQLWRYGLRRIACGRFRGFELAVDVGGMANPESLGLRIPILHLQTDYFPDS